MSSMQGQNSSEYLAESQGYTVIAVSAVLLVAQLLAVIFRLQARKKKGLPFYLDDYLILPALIFGTTLCILNIAAVPTLGLGRHIEAATLINPSAAGISNQLTFTQTLLSYTGALLFAKLSTASFYNRVFAPTSWVRLATYLTAALTLLTSLTAFLAPFVSCTPLTTLFTAHPSPAFIRANCINAPLYLTLLSAPNLLSDLLLLLTPLPIIWTLNQHTRQKLGLTAAFALGGANTVCSALRLYAYYDWARRSPSADPTWAAVQPATWSAVEAAACVVAACVPHLRPLVKWIVPKTGPRERLHGVGTSRRGGCWLRRLEERINGGRAAEDDAERGAWWNVLRAREAEGGGQGVVRGEEGDEGMVVWEGQEKGGERARVEQWVEELDDGEGWGEEGWAKKDTGASWGGIVVCEEIVVVTETVGGCEAYETFEGYEGAKVESEGGDSGHG